MDCNAWLLGSNVQRVDAVALKDTIFEFLLEAARTDSRFKKSEHGYARGDVRRQQCCTARSPLLAATQTHGVEAG
jgi:hypothetical protein